MKWNVLPSIKNIIEDRILYTVMEVKENDIVGQQKF